MQVHCPLHNLPMQTEKLATGVYWVCADGCLGVERDQWMHIKGTGNKDGYFFQQRQDEDTTASSTGNLESANDSGV